MSELWVVGGRMGNNLWHLEFRTKLFPIFIIICSSQHNIKTKDEYFNNYRSSNRGLHFIIHVDRNFTQMYSNLWFLIKHIIPTQIKFYQTPSHLSSFTSFSTVVTITIEFPFLFTYFLYTFLICILNMKIAKKKKK